MHVPSRRTAPRRPHKPHLPVEGEPTGPDPECSGIATRNMQCIRGALARLTPKKRIAFCLWCYEGMEMGEIAALTNSTLSATRGRVLHAQGGAGQRSFISYAGGGG